MAKVILRRMHAWAAASDAYDAPVNYRRASGNARDGEHIKSLIYYPEIFYFGRHLIYIRNNWTTTLLHVAKKKTRSFRNYRSFSLNLSEEKIPGGR